MELPKKNKFLALLLILFLEIFTSPSIFFAKEKFDSLISKKEKRIIEYKNELSGTVNFPETMKLFYKGKKDDFLVFYDWNRHEAYYIYRRNKFDYEAEEKVVSLIEGCAYEISGKFSGMIISVKKGEEKINPFPKFIRNGEFLSLEEKKNKENIPVFIFQSFRTMELDELIY
ncbi:MAG: hypothetical protein L6Q54_12030 [Leptospiraceae bacterium]|nr:hypothetical protein [Leptospiraceae bacterium]MCK6381959.1 hypothetical protein [Leptospiraceae bacterium]NUM40297.1 hypothetical protein [Leptospiraceae bacterium]